MAIVPSGTTAGQQTMQTGICFLSILACNRFGPLRDTKRWSDTLMPGFFSRDDCARPREFLFYRTYKKAFGQRRVASSQNGTSTRFKSEDNDSSLQMSCSEAVGCDVSEGILKVPRAALVHHCP